MCKKKFKKKSKEENLSKEEFFVEKPFLIFNTVRQVYLLEVNLGKILMTIIYNVRHSQHDLHHICRQRSLDQNYLHKIRTGINRPTIG